MPRTRKKLDVNPQDIQDAVGATLNVPPTAQPIQQLDVAQQQTVSTNAVKPDGTITGVTNAPVPQTVMNPTIPEIVQPKEEDIPTPIPDPVPEHLAEVPHLAFPVNVPVETYPPFDPANPGTPLHTLFENRVTVDTDAFVQAAVADAYKKHGEVPPFVVITMMRRITLPKDKWVDFNKGAYPITIYAPSDPEVAPYLIDAKTNEPYPLQYDQAICFFKLGE